MARKCRKCGNSIPYSVVFENKRKSLQNRKFCLDCSPYGKHNTRKDDPSITTEPKNKPFREWSSDKKLLHTARVYRRGIERKEKLIEMAGGKCLRCGYSKCHRALSFHHRDPTNKKFGLSLNVLWGTAWDKIIEEFNKCDLLCIRCHLEIEDELTPINENSYRSIIKGLEHSGRR